MVVLHHYRVPRDLMTGDMLSVLTHPNRPIQHLSIEALKISELCQLY